MGIDPLAVPLSWDEQGVPFSTVFTDKYFCADNGYADACHVFLNGNQLPQRFASLHTQSPGVFTIVETGFGTGLDFCAAWKMWHDYAPRQWRLNFISVELYPLSTEDLRKALVRWPELDLYMEALAAQYVPDRGAVRQFLFDQERISLTIAFDDVVTALIRIREMGLVPQGADALFLGGFAPSRNPLMWSLDVFRQAALLSHPGTTLATFTVAGAVRRGLEANGFYVERYPGYGKKKNILGGYFK